MIWLLSKRTGLNEVKQNITLKRFFTVLIIVLSEMMDTFDIFWIKSNAMALCTLVTGPIFVGWLVVLGLTAL